MKAASKQPEVHLEPPLDFLRHLWQLNHALERVSLQMERTLGVTAQQRLLIRCIGKYPGLTATQLSAVLHLDRGTVSVGLTRLERKQLITRRRVLGDDRRRSLGLTRKGALLNRPDPSTVENAVAQLLARARASDVARVKAFLRTLAEDLARRVVPRTRPRS